MQEENSNVNGIQEEMSVVDLFLTAQETYDQAEARVAEESKKFKKIEFFKMDKLGVYRLRVLPIVPEGPNQPPKRPYEFPVHQMLLKIAHPGNDKKSFYVSVPRTDYAGYSVDLLSVYRKLAVQAAEKAGDEKLAKKIDANSFSGGLKYDYRRCMYVLDLEERKKGLQLLQLSETKFTDLRTRSHTLWGKKKVKDEKHPCPISSILNAYPVEVEKKKDGSKTVCVFSIDNESDYDELSREELNALIAAPRIPEVIYRYTRYQFGATVEFLKQCDERYGLSILESEEMQEAISSLESQLPADDNRTFSFEKKDSEEGDEKGSGDALTLDYLFDRYDELNQQGLGDKTEEGQELRAMIREFIEEKGLDIRITRSTSNGDVLEMIEQKMN